MNAFAVKCRCQHCNQNIEFEASRAGETVACPQCGMETLLFIPQSGSAPSQTARQSSPKTIPTLIGCFIAVVVLIPVVLFLRGLGEDRDDVAGGLLGLVFLVVGFIGGFIIYFLPSIIASKKQKRNRQAIFALNLLAGWTFIGWVIAFVWACTVDPEPAH